MNPINLIVDLSMRPSTEGIEWSTSDYLILELNPHNVIKLMPFRLKYYEIIICIQGSARVEVRGDTNWYQANTLAAFIPNTIVNIIELSDDYQARAVIFHNDFMIETLNNIYFMERFNLMKNKGTDYIQLEQKEMTKLLDCFRRIYEVQGDVLHPFRRDIIRSLVIIMLYETENILLNKGMEAKYDKCVTGKEKILSDFKELLQKHFYKQRKITFYAQELNMTSALLSKQLKEITGQTAKEHIDDITLSQAKVLLKTGKYNVSEVAALLYYENIEEFSRFFKKRVGISPLKFSKEG